MGNENQQVVQQQYQQQVMVPVSQSVQGPMPVYYSVITPAQQNSTRYACMDVYRCHIHTEEPAVQQPQWDNFDTDRVFILSPQPVSRLPAAPQL